MGNTQESIEKKHSLGIVSLVMAILSIFTGLLGIIFIPIAIVFGYKSYKKERSPFGIAGLIISGLVTAFFTVTIALSFYVTQNSPGPSSPEETFNKLMFQKMNK